jgi:hypothetical protein
MGENAVAKLSPWHAAIVDWEFSHPDKKMKECAKHFQVTEPWLSRLRNSDLFIAYREERRVEHNKTVSLTIVDRVETVADITLEVIAERVKEEREDISLSLLTEIGGMALTALGFGSKAPQVPGGGSAVNVNIGIASPAALESARGLMIQLQAEDVEVIEHEGEAAPVEAIPAPS